MRNVFSQFAIRYMTYKVPSVTKEPMQVLLMMRRITKPLGNTLVGLLAVNGFAAAMLTYLETSSFLSIQEQMKNVRARYELEHSQ